jgi:hypothetical protein
MLSVMISECCVEPFMLSAVMLNVIMLNVIKCNYAESRGALIIKSVMFSFEMKNLLFLGYETKL